jgi:hypothetical protein
MDREPWARLDRAGPNAPALGDNEGGNDAANSVGGINMSHATTKIRGAPQGGAVNLGMLNGMTPIYMKTIVDSITGPGASATARARRA